MKDGQLRAVCFWIAAYAGLASVAGILFAPLRLILLPSTIFVSATAVLLFLRMLFSRTYRRGVDAANREMQGNDPWPGRPKKVLDPNWGFFGSRGGSPALLWLRTVLVIGVLPMMLLQYWTGIEVVWLWLAGAFVAMELSVMHLALSQPH
jgi:fatty acid desaturase